MPADGSAQREHAHGAASSESQQYLRGSLRGSLPAPSPAARMQAPGSAAVCSIAGEPRHLCFEAGRGCRRRLRKLSSVERRKSNAPHTSAGARPSDTSCQHSAGAFTARSIGEASSTQGLDSGNDSHGGRLHTNAGRAAHRRDKLRERPPHTQRFSACLSTCSAHTLSNLARSVW